MGKDLHYTIITFLEDCLRGHSMVESFQRFEEDDFYYYKVKRRIFDDYVIILLSDEYYYGNYQYLQRQVVLSEGGVILVARPEAYFSDEIQAHYKEDKVIVGKIGVLLGCLRHREYWLYEKPIKKDKQAQKPNND